MTRLSAFLLSQFVYSLLGATCVILAALVMPAYGAWLTYAGYGLDWLFAMSWALSYVAAVRWCAQPEAS